MNSVVLLHWGIVLGTLGACCDPDASNSTASTNNSDDADETTSIASTNNSDDVDYKSLYLKSQRELKEEKEKSYAVQCTQEQRYAMKYFEWIFTRAEQLDLPDFNDVLTRVKLNLFEKLRKSKTENPTVYLNQTVSKRFKDLDDNEIEWYKLRFIRQCISNAEKWEILPIWLNESDEYKRMKNGNMMNRLERFVQAIRQSITEFGLTPALITACLQRNWDRLSKIAKVAPSSFNYTEIFQAYHAMNLPNQLAKYCAILLENIIKEIPLTVDERSNFTRWTNEQAIRFESWELDPERPVPPEEPYARSECKIIYQDQPQTACIMYCRYMSSGYL